MPTAEQLIAALDLRPLPVEGGFFREMYRSSRSHGDTSASTAIYYLLTPETFSALHRLPTDEVYHFYLGDPVELLLLDESGGRIVTLGSDVLAGQHPQFVVPQGAWQGSVLRSGGRFALMGTTVAPAFDFSDFEAGRRDELIRRHPAFAERIGALCRRESD